MKIINGAHRFGGARLDKNGNPKLGYHHPAPPAPDFDKSKVIAGIAQIWRDTDGTRYMPVELLPATDTLPERFSVSVLSPSGDVSTVERVASFFASLTLDESHLQRPHARRDRVWLSAEKVASSAGAPDDAILQSQLATYEIAASLAKFHRAATDTSTRIGDASAAVGSMSWSMLAAGLMQTVHDMEQGVDALRNIATAAEQMALRTLPLEDAIILDFIAGAGAAGVDGAEIQSKLESIMDPRAIHAFASRVNELMVLGWLTSDGERIFAAPRLFEVVFHPHDGPTSDGTPPDADKAPSAG